MKTQYVGVIFTNDIQPGANAKTYYFRDNTGAAVGDELVVRLSTGRLAVVEVVTVSDVAPSERLLGARKKYLENKQYSEALYTEVIRTTTKTCPLKDVARTLLCAAAGQDADEIKEAWNKYFEAEKLQEEVESYEKEYGICE